MVRKRICGLLLACVMGAVTVFLSGCMMQTADKMYSLPKRSEEFSELQLQLNRVMSSVEYAAPIAGDNQQAVQLSDLDGDGEEEALLFSKGADERPLKIYVFDKQGDSYVNIATLESTGTAFEQVEYAQIDGSAGMELIVGRQVSDEVLRALSVYTFRSGQAELLASTVYTRFLTTDLDTNGQKELVVFRPGADNNGVAEIYDYQNNAMERRSEAAMSAPVDGVKRVITGNMCQNVPAVFVASAYDDTQVITDVYALQEGKLTNVTQLAPGGNSVRAIRNKEVFAEDIDGDGLIELPEQLTMPEPEGAAPQTNRYLLQWYNLQPDGSHQNKKTTYHCCADGYYVDLPPDWAEQVVVLRSDAGPGEISYAFCGWENGLCTAPIFTVYVFSGDSRTEAAAAEGNFTLARNDEVIFAAAIGEEGVKRGIDENAVKNAFHLIRTPWKTGET